MKKGTSRDAQSLSLYELGMHSEFQDLRWSSRKCPPLQAALIYDSLQRLILFPSLALILADLSLLGLALC